MASFEEEEVFVSHLLRRKRIDWRMLTNPNTKGPDTGLDVLVHTDDSRFIGVQVTTVDPHPQPGEARGKEKKISGGLYGDFAQNDPQVYVSSLKRAIEQKIESADRGCKLRPEVWEKCTEAWLLVCAGIPARGATVSTLLITPILNPHDIEIATGDALRKSKYDQCFLFPIEGVEGAFYERERGLSWKKSVLLGEINERARIKYLDDLVRAKLAGDCEEFERLCDAEVKTAIELVRKNAIEGGYR
jgi:hypothetical protein